MPQSPYLFKRGSIFYFRVRIPLDLVEAKVYGDKTEIKGSLKTTDRKKALTLGAERLAETRNEFDAKREELRTGKAPFSLKAFRKAKREEYEAGKRAEIQVSESARPLSELSEAERWEIVVEELVAQERGAQATRSLPLSVVKDPDSDVYFDVHVALAMDDGSSWDYGQEPTDWEQVTKRTLAKRDIRVDDLEAFTVLQEDLKAASIESSRRTLDYFDSGCLKQRCLNPRFKDIWASHAMLGEKSSEGSTVGQLVKKFMDEKGRAPIAPKTLDALRFSCEVVEEFFGTGYALPKLSREEGARFIDFLATLPSNARQRYRGSSLRKAAELETEKKVPALLSPKRRWNIFNDVKALLNYAVDELGWIPRNPFKGKLAERLPKVQKVERLQFTPDELPKVFDCQVMREERHRINDDGVPTQAKYWVPWICLYHGLRANEACQLAVFDCLEEDGVPFLHITDSLVQGHTRRLKTSESKRKVPLHRKLVELGFLEYIQLRRIQDESGFLFPELKTLKTGSRADMVSKWFSRLKDTMLSFSAEKRGEKTMHSLRHSFRGALRRGSVSKEIADALGGWVSGQRNSGDSYGERYPVRLLKTEIDKVHYPTLNEVGTTLKADRRTSPRQRN